MIKVFDVKNKNWEDLCKLSSDNDIFVVFERPNYHPNFFHASDLDIDTLRGVYNYLKHGKDSSTFSDVVEIVYYPKNR